MSKPTPYALPPEPGTYYIVNVHTGTVIEVPNYNQGRLISSKWLDKTNQHWFVQHSGRGYKIKNRQHGVYLSAPDGGNNTIVGVNKTPTVWNLLRAENGFIIQYGDEDRIVNLLFASANDGNALNLTPSLDFPVHRRWKFERISGDTGGEKAEKIEDEVARLKQELASKDQELANKDQEMAEKDRTIAALVASLRYMGAPQSVASDMAELSGRLDKIGQFTREAKDIMDALSAEDPKQRPKNIS